MINPSEEVKNLNSLKKNVENEDKMKFKDEHQQFNEIKPFKQSKVEDVLVYDVATNSIIEEGFTANTIPKFAINRNQFEDIEKINENTEKNFDNNPKNVQSQIKEQQNAVPIYQLLNNQSQIKNDEDEKKLISENQNLQESSVQSGIKNIDSDLKLIWKCILNNDLIIFFMLATNENMQNIKLQAFCNRNILQIENIWPLKEAKSPQYYLKVCIQDFNKKNFEINVLLEKKISQYQMKFNIFFNSQTQKFVFKKILNNKQLKAINKNDEQLFGFIEKMFCCFSLYDFINYFSDYSDMHKLFCQQYLETTLKQHLNSNNSLIMNYLLIVSNKPIEMQFGDYELFVLFEKLVNYLKNEKKNNQSKRIEQQVLSKEILKMKRKINDWFQKIHKCDLIEQFIQFQGVLDLQMSLGQNQVNILLQNQKQSLISLFEFLQEKQIYLDYKTWFEVIKDQACNINNLAQLQEYVTKNQFLILKLIQDQEKMHMKNQQQSLEILISIDEVILTRFIEDQIQFLNVILQKFNFNHLNERDSNEIQEIIGQFSKHIQIQTLKNILLQLETFEENQYKQIIEKLFELYHQKIDKNDKFQQNQFLEIKIDFKNTFDHLKKLFQYAFERLEQNTFIQEFDSLNKILTNISQSNSQFKKLSEDYQEKFITFLNQEIIKKCLSQNSFQKILYDLTQQGSLKQEFQYQQIFDQIVEQLQQIKKLDPYTIFSDDFYSLFVFLLSNDQLFKRHQFYISCMNYAKKFKNIEDIEWGIIQHYEKNEDNYIRFLQVFNQEIKFNKKQKKILKNASQKLSKVEQFLNILTKIFQVQTNNHIIQKCYNLNQTYYKTKWSNISQNKDLEELNNYQDIIQISYQLYNSIVFKSIATQFSQKNQIDEIYQIIKQQIMPLLFYTARQVSIGTGLDFSQKVQKQSIISNQYISQQVIQDYPNVQSYLYILENYLIKINQEEEDQEMKNLNDILEFIFPETKFNQYINENKVGEFMENSRQIYRQIQITYQIIQISKSAQVELPDQLDLTIQKLNKLQQENENTYQEMIEFYQDNQQKFSQLYVNVEDTQFKLIPILKNYSKILNKCNDQTLNDLKLSDEQDIAEQINWLIFITKKLKEYNAYGQVQQLDKEKNLISLLKQVSNIINLIQYDQSLTKQIEGVSISFQRIKDYLEEQQGGQSSISVMNQFLELGTIIITFQDISGRLQEEIVFQIEEPLKKFQQPQQAQIFNQQQQGQKQNSSNKSKSIIKKCDMDEIYSIQSRLNLQVQNIQGDSDNKHIDIKEKKQHFDDLVKYSQNIAQTIIFLDEEGSLEDQIQQIIIQIKNNKPMKIIEELQEVISIYKTKIQQWNKTLEDVNFMFPVLQLIPLHLLRKFSYYIFKKYIQLVDQNEQFEVNNRYSPKQIRPSIIVQQIQFDFKNFMIESNCQHFLQMIFINPSKINFKAFENELTKFSDPNSEPSSRIQIIAQILQEAFSKNNGIQLIKGCIEHLQICRKQVTDYQDCIKFLLRFPSIQSYQVLICNQDTNFQDISCFFLRATKFEIAQKQIDSEKYFLCNFDQLNYISQQKTIKLINQINTEFTKSQNKIFIIYKDQRDKQQLQNIANYQIINDAWQDFLQINHDDCQYQDQVSVNKGNIYTYTSKRAGEGKTYQIQQKILSEAQKSQYIRVPLHQFENIDSFISNIIKNTPNNRLQKYYHLDVCYDETDEKLNFEKDLDPHDNQIREKNKMKKYNNLDKDILALKVSDFIIVTQIKDKSTYQMQEIIKFLQQYVQIYNKIQQKEDKSEYVLQFPDFSQNQQDSLAQVVVDIVCEEPGQFYNLETKKNNENLQKILSNFVFSPDNAFKMVLIAFRIQAGLPVIIMGETGIGKTYSIKLLSQLMKYEFRVIEIDSGLHVDKIVNAILEYQNDEKWDKQKVIIFLDEVNTTYCVNGIIKEIIIDRHINGVKIKDNIVFVAACNPYQYKKYNVQQDNQQQNNQQQQKKSYQLEYKVKPLRESFSYCIINFKSLSEEQEQLYIENLINMYKLKNDKCDINQQDIQQLKILIFQSQLFVRKESCERSVSLRDVNRFLVLFFYFYQTYFRIKLENDKSNYDQKAVMNEVKRELYLKFYEFLFAENKCPVIKFKQTVNEELKWLTNECGIQSQYIAKNNALKENIFCIIICILNKIPLIITGEPGTSKTLSFSIALTCLKGNTQSKFFTSQPTIKEFYYQGNPQTTSKHIQDVFNQARKYQASINSKFQVIPLVVIDEIGQGEGNKNNPNKILHYQLENCDVAFLAISNIDLDVSNMNRCLHLYRQRFTEQDLKDFIEEIMKGFKNFPKEIKDEIFQIAQIYHKFQQGQNTQKHGTRDFYYTVKYTCHKLNMLIEQNIKVSIQEIQKMIAQAFFKNFGGDNQNQQIIMKLVKDTFQLDDQTLQISQTDLIRENIDSINNGDFYHSRFLMLVTKDPISCTNYVQSLFKQYNKNCEVFMGSHFRDDHTIDLSRDISKLNSRIESGINVISVQQYYLYTIYYDFFTMNFIRMGENNTFRISYKQFSKRVQVKPDFIFVIIAHQDEYEHMDPALLNRFEKYTISLKDLLCGADRKIFGELKQEIRSLENVQSNMKLFTFSSESELYSLIIQQRQHNNESHESLKQKCLSKLGDLTFRTYIFHNKKNENNAQYKDWLNRSYLDNLLSYLHYQRQQINEKQEPFKSIIYTTSFTHDKYKQLIDQEGFNSKIINLKIYPTKDLFIQQLEEFYNKGAEDLLIIAVDQNFESYKNLCYLQYELQYQHSLYHQKNNKMKNIIITIQLSSLNIKGLAFLENWNQVQIENLLPYVYTVHMNLSRGILEKANQKLNYRYLTNNNIITILTEKSDSDIFLYFISMPGFFASLMTSIQINDNQTKNQSNQKKFSYLNSRIEYFKKVFSFQDKSDYSRQLLKFFYEQFEKKIRNYQNYDVQWSKNIQFPNLVYKKDGKNKKENKTQSIPILNFEKILINQLRSYVVEQLSEIVVIMEKKNFINENLIKEDEINEEQRKYQIEMIKEYFQNFEYKQTIIKILQKIPQPFKLIQSKQIYKKVEESKFHKQPLTFKNIQEDKTYLLLYIEDFFTIKGFLPIQLKEVLLMMVESNKLSSFKSIHQFCWDYEDIFTQNSELFRSLQVNTFTQDFKQFIIKNNFNINKEELNIFFRNTSFQFIANQSLLKNVNKFIQQVNIFIKFYSNDHKDSQILIYLQKLREIFPYEYQSQYEEIQREILKSQSLGILKLQEYVCIQELSQIDQIKFGIKMNLIHLNLSLINDKQKQISFDDFLNNTFVYLQQVQINSDNIFIDPKIRSIIKQGISIIVVQYIEQNEYLLSNKLMQELLPNQQNTSNISNLLRQFFDKIQISISSPLSIIFIETFFNELTAFNKTILLQKLNFVIIYNAYKDSCNDYANLRQFIAVSCLKILSQVSFYNIINFEQSFNFKYLTDPIKQTMQNGILEFQIQNNSFIELLTNMSQSFDTEDPQKNPFHNHIISQIIGSLHVSLKDYVNKLEKNKQNCNQLNFIYQFVSKQEEYQAKLKQLSHDKESCTMIFKISDYQYYPSDRLGILNILNVNKNNLNKIQYIYPIISLIKIIYVKFAYKFNENDLKQLDLSQIFNNSSQISESQLLQSKIAIEKLLDLNDDVSQLKLFELICSKENQLKSRIFKQINELIRIQNQIINKLCNSQEKLILETTQSDFIEIKSELLDKKYIYFFSDEEGKVNYEDLQDFYKNELLEYKPKICGLDKIDFKFKQQFYKLDLLYYNLQHQQKLSLDKIQNLEDLYIDTESCVEMRTILIKLNQILKVKGNIIIDSEILIEKLLENNNEKEKLDPKTIQILGKITYKHLCSLIQYFENKIMDYLISQLLTRKCGSEQIQQDQTLNQFIQCMEKNQIQLNTFKNLIGRFILRLNKNFQVDSLQNNLFQNIFDPKYNQEFFSSNESVQYSFSVQQELTSLLFTNEDSYLIYQRLTMQIDANIKKQQQELLNQKLEQNKNKINQNAIKLEMFENYQEIQLNIDQDLQDESQFSDNESLSDAV
ncbi:hypothetical protein ABPG72_005113 [Tetrahymena utriculariae]